MIQQHLRAVPTTLAEANNFVTRAHRHHGPTLSHRFSTGVIDEEETLRGVAIMGRPVARKTDHRAVLEVTRVATDGCPNACSALYGQACRIGKAHGFAKAQTFILASEPGTSLKAAGWRPVGITPGKPWAVPTRDRDRKPTTEGPKVRWECRCSTLPTIQLDT